MDQELSELYSVVSVYYSHRSCPHFFDESGGPHETVGSMEWWVVGGGKGKNKCK